VCQLERVSAIEMLAQLMASCGVPEQHVDLAAEGEPENMFGAADFYPFFFRSGAFCWLLMVARAVGGLAGSGAGRTCGSNGPAVMLPPPIDLHRRPF
jgi:hypothetical protein